jgi:hypothetical protein
MDLDRDDLAVLCEGLTKDEVDRIHRLIHEWNVGPTNSFPVQLALLTNAQWRIAANLPRLMNDSRKLIELHLAEHRRHSKATTDEFVGTAKQQMAEYKSATETVRQASKKISVDLAEAEAVVRRTKFLVDDSASEWRAIRNATKTQSERLEQISNELQSRFTWREILWGAFWFGLVFGMGIYLGHFAWKH